MYYATFDFLYLIKHLLVQLRNHKNIRGMLGTNYCNCWIGCLSFFIYCIVFRYMNTKFLQIHLLKYVTVVLFYKEQEFKHYNLKMYLFTHI